jgi:hypothetical protein
MIAFNQESFEFNEILIGQADCGALSLMITSNGLEFGTQCTNMIILGYQVQLNVDTFVTI